MNGENNLMSSNIKSKIEFTPIGYFTSEQKEPYQAARQPDSLSSPGAITLYPKNNFEQALTNLDQCSHIWIIYQFHHNENWKPMVQTPRSEEKIGVFATRAPYRPNPIGMTAVKLLKVDGLIIEVGPNDLLDGTPILDIKPYHTESDLIENTEIGWLNEAKTQSYQIQLSPLAEDQFDFLSKNGLSEVKTFVQRQLEYDPTNHKKKRVQFKDSIWELAYRTWRVYFLVTDDLVSIVSVSSGYSSEDLHSSEDKYMDKEIHKKFNTEFL